MAFSVAQGTFTKPTGAAPATNLIANPGFVPKAIIFYCTRQTVTGLIDHYVFSIGFAVAGSRCCLGVRSVDNVAPTVTNAAIKNFGTSSALMILSTSAATATAQSAISAVTFNADNTITVTWNPNEAIPHIIHYLILGGADLTNYSVTAEATPTVTGIQTYTGPGFQPDAMLLVGIDDVSSGGISPSIACSIGVVVSDMSQGVVGFTTRDAQSPHLTKRKLVTTRCLSVPVQGGTAISYEAAIAAKASWPANGYALNFTVVSTTAKGFFVLALKGGQYQMGLANAPTVSGNTTTPVTIGQPRGLIFLNRSAVASTTFDLHNRLGFGAVGTAGGIKQSRIWLGDTSSASPTNTNETTLLSDCIRMSDVDGGATGIVGALSQLTATDFTIAWVADGTQPLFPYLWLAFADSPAAAPQTVTAEFIQGQEVVFAPTVTGSQIVNAEFISAQETIYAPASVLNDAPQTVTAGFISGQEIVFVPAAVTQGPAATDPVHANLLYSADGVAYNVLASVQTENATLTRIRTAELTMPKWAAYYFKAQVGGLLPSDYGVVRFIDLNDFPFSAQFFFEADILRQGAGQYTCESADLIVRLR